MERGRIRLQFLSESGRMIITLFELQGGSHSTRYYAIKTNKTHGLQQVPRWQIEKNSPNPLHRRLGWNVLMISFLAVAQSFSNV